jgi:hypothetical protein
MEMNILLKPMYMFKVILLKIPTTVFNKIEMSFVRFIWKHKIPSIVKVFLSQRSNVRGITILDFTLQSNKNSIVLAQKQT